MTFEIFTVAGILLSLLRYATYIRGMARGTTKPHPLTWLGAALMAGIACAIQVMGQAGPTVWITGVVTLFCLGIGTAAIFVGERRITTSDWISFSLALLVIPIWLTTKQPTIAIVLVLLIELLNYYPTIRKSYSKPEEENVVSWALSALRWLSATASVSNITLDTIFYPSFITVCETSVVVYLLWRRHALRKTGSLIAKPPLSSEGPF